MSDSTVVQFAGYASNLETGVFLEQWHEYAKPFEKKSSGITLWKQLQTRSRYAFISKHHWPVDDFQFSFMGNRKSDYFADRSVRVIQAGGYVETGGNPPAEKPTGPVMVVFAFIKEIPSTTEALLQDADAGQYREYQAFYESCLYSQIFEFYTTEADMPDLLARLRRNEGVEVSVYLQCYAATPAKEKSTSKKASKTV